MAADPGFRLTFRVLLVPLRADGSEDRDRADAIDAGTTEIALRLETGRPGSTMRSRATLLDGDFGDASHAAPEPGSAAASRIGGPERGLVLGYGSTGDAQRRLTEIETALDVQRHMPQEDVDRLSAEAARLRQRVTPRDVPHSRRVMIPGGTPGLDPQQQR